jgi:hypothetical protein
LQGDFWKHLDYYIGLGLGYTAATPTGTYADYYKSVYGNSYSDGFGGGLGIAAYSGLSYFINDKIAVYIEGDSFTSLGSTILGVSYKF